MKTVQLPSSFVLPFFRLFADQYNINGSVVKLLELFSFTVDVIKYMSSHSYGDITKIKVTKNKLAITVGEDEQQKVHLNTERVSVAKQVIKHCKAPIAGLAYDKRQ